MRPVDIWLEKQRIYIMFLDPPVQLAIEGEMECLPAVSTLGLDLGRKTFVT